MYGQKKRSHLSRSHSSEEPGLQILCQRPLRNWSWLITEQCMQSGIWNWCWSFFLWMAGLVHISKWLDFSLTCFVLRAINTFISKPSTLSVRSHFLSIQIPKACYLRLSSSQLIHPTPTVRGTEEAAEVDFDSKEPVGQLNLHCNNFRLTDQLTIIKKKPKLVVAWSAPPPKWVSAAHNSLPRPWHLWPTSTLGAQPPPQPGPEKLQPTFVFFRYFWNWQGQNIKPLHACSRTGAGFMSCKW